MKVQYIMLQLHISHNYLKKCQVLYDQACLLEIYIYVLLISLANYALRGNVTAARIMFTDTFIWYKSVVFCC